MEYINVKRVRTSALSEPRHSLVKAPLEPGIRSQASYWNCLTLCLVYILSQLDQQI